MSGDYSTHRLLIGGNGSNRPDDINFPIVVAPNGNVGLGALNPEGKLDVRTADNSDVNIALQAGISTRWWMSADYSAHRLLIGGEGASRPDDINFPIVVAPNGNVGLGALNPEGKLDVRTADNSDVNIAMQAGVSTRWWISADYSAHRLLIGGEGASRPDDINFPIVVAPNGNIGIGTTNPSAKLDIAGRTKTCVLEITGGCDLAEPFEISESQPIPKGALVIIDEENPGRLKLSHQAYDKRVAGVVSGAGSINPGLTLTQQGVLEGRQNVALSGRVYALATTANGPIKPGDLLTTSDVPGHAMKATDRELSNGAIIGKAMSSLEGGEGLVLVLVNLQ